VLVVLGALAFDALDILQIGVVPLQNNHTRATEAAELWVRVRVTEYSMDHRRKLRDLLQTVVLDAEEQVLRLYQRVGLIG
jgi:hypothetical protein